MPNKRQLASWWWLLPLLWLTMALTLPRLDMDGLWYDEVWSVINAGGAHYGAMSPSEIWEHLATNDPDQGIAYPLLLSAWGSVVGWSELATRLLSLFAGLLTIAGTYRLGREWLSPGVGLIAAALLSVNTFYINYLHELRVFSIVTLAAVLVLWCYGRLMFSPSGKPPQWMILANIRVSVGWVIGGLGLLYTHYFAATLLLALGIMHMGLGIWALISQKNRGFIGRRWWQIVLLALVVALLFVPWLPVLMQSIARTATRSDVHERSLTTLDLLDSIGRYFLNWDMPGVGVVLLGVLGVGAVAVFWSKHRDVSPQTVLRAQWMVALTVVLLAGVLAANAFLQIIEPNRARYILVLWVPLALSSAILVHRLSAVLYQRFTGRRNIMLILGIGMITVWFANGLRVYWDADFLRALDGGDTVRWRTMTTILQAEGQPQDVFVFYAGTPKAAYDNQFSFEHSTHDVVMPHFQSAIFLDEMHLDWALTHIEQAHRVWYGVDKRQPITDAYTIFDSLLTKLIRCDQVVNDTQLILTLYGRYAAFCPQDDTIIEFAAGISLRAYQIISTDNKLIVPTSWTLQPHVPSNVYSVSVQLLDTAGNLIAQKDDGLSHSHFTTLISELEMTNVPTGDYRLRLVVYAWQTGVVVGEFVLSDEISHSQ